MPEHRLERTRRAYDGLRLVKGSRVAADEDGPNLHGGDASPAYIAYSAHCPYNLGGHVFDRGEPSPCCHFCGPLVVHHEGGVS